MEEVLLHVGMHKTGTTTLQSALAGYDDGETVTADLEFPNHSVPVYTAFSEAPERYHFWRAHGLSQAQVEERRRGYLQMLDGQLARSDRRRLVISGEDISVLDAREKATLTGFLTARAPKLHVVCYLRAPAAYAGSALGQRIKGGVKTLPESCSPQYRLRLEGFRTDPRISRLSVRKFAPGALRKRDIVEDFAVRHGLDPARMARSPLNEGLSAAALKLIFHFNKAMPLSAGDLVLMQARQALVREVSEAYPGPGLGRPWLRCLADESELGYAEAQFGLSFGPPPPRPAAGRGKLEAHLDDLSGIDLSPLDGLLGGHGIAGSFGTPAEKLIRLYLWHVYDRQHAQQQKREAKAAAPTPSPGSGS
ncbi:hypothetical protein [Poseidonocella sp. HB161398]|uniref:hypothetical protein n=1 Tax=Poseidonocella sp. HB161398 TaxID=2320855 RepID=UPI0011090CEB|nr:hypothetical protein [Poseidonocella sp. HB161398]